LDAQPQTCLRRMDFRYAVAAASTDTSPCSNVPVRRILEQVWKYQLGAHFRQVHSIQDARNFPLMVEIPEDERTTTKIIWDARKKV
ncbi:hypothetical protein R3P38DRAFT_2423597, partial [Favolaschia claudopus]